MYKWINYKETQGRNNTRKKSQESGSGYFWRQGKVMIGTEHMEEFLTYLVNFYILT